MPKPVRGVLILASAFFFSLSIANHRTASLIDDFEAATDRAGFTFEIIKNESPDIPPRRSLGNSPDDFVSPMGQGLDPTGRDIADYLTVVAVINLEKTSLSSDYALIEEIVFDGTVRRARPSGTVVAVIEF